MKPDGRGSAYDPGMAADHIARGRAALERWDWIEARAAFESALAEAESPDALMGLQQAITHLGDGRLAVETAERAYRLYRDAGEDEPAAMPR